MTKLPPIALAKERLERYSLPLDESGCVQWSGAVLTSGYGQLSVLGQNWRAHRLAYFAEYGHLTPGLVVNHICGNITCINAKDHLEEIEQGKNVQYKNKLSSNNTSGHRNVYWDKSRCMWMVAVRIEGKSHHVGRFQNKAEAISAAKAARIKFNFHLDGGVSE